MIVKIFNTFEVIFFINNLFAAELEKLSISARCRADIKIILIKRILDSNFLKTVVVYYRIFRKSVLIVYLIVI